MKINKLSLRTSASTMEAEIVYKINEIIDLLNNSFLTQEYDEAIIDVMDSVTNISCGRVTNMTDETTCELTEKIKE